MRYHAHHLGHSFYTYFLKSRTPQNEEDKINLLLQTFVTKQFQ